MLVSQLRPLFRMGAEGDPRRLCAPWLLVIANHQSMLDGIVQQP